MSTWTSKLQEDLYTWLADKEDEMIINETDEWLAGLPRTIEECLPPFVLGWTVKELIVALNDIGDK